MRYAWLLLLLLAACESENDHGKCYGFYNRDEVKKPAQDYDLSGRNIVLGVVFSETIIVPLWVALEEYSCPTGLPHSAHA